MNVLLWCAALPAAAALVVVLPPVAAAEPSVAPALTGVDTVVWTPCPADSPADITHDLPAPMSCAPRSTSPSTTPTPADGRWG